MKVGVLLAAGDGVRMGGPKALLRVKGEPLVRLHVRRLFESGCDSVVVAVRPEVAPLLSSMRVTVVASRCVDPAGSLALCVEALPVQTRVVVVQLVAMLPVQVETHQRLVRALDEGALAASPRFRGVGGHPVVARREVFDGYDGRPLCDVLDSLGAARVRLEVDDVAVASRLERRGDVARWVGGSPEFDVGPSP